MEMFALFSIFSILLVDLINFTGATEKGGSLKISLLGTRKRETRKAPPQVDEHEHESACDISPTEPGAGREVIAAADETIKKLMSMTEEEADAAIEKKKRMAERAWRKHAEELIMRSTEDELKEYKPVYQKFKQITRGSELPSREHFDGDRYLFQLGNMSDRYRCYVNSLSSIYKNNSSSILHLLTDKIPKLSVEEENKLQLQHCKYGKVDWWYDLPDVPSKGDKVFNGMSWFGPMPSKSITSTRLYNKLYEKVKDMKNAVLEVDKLQKLIKSLKDSIKVLPSYSLALPVNLENKATLGKFEAFLNTFFLFYKELGLSINRNGLMTNTPLISEFQSTLTDFLKEIQDQVTSLAKQLNGALYLLSKNEKLLLEEFLIYYYSAFEQSHKNLENQNALIDDSELRGDHLSVMGNMFQMYIKTMQKDYDRSRREFEKIYGQGKYLGEQVNSLNNTKKLLKRQFHTKKAFKMLLQLDSLMILERQLKDLLIFCINSIQMDTIPLSLINASDASSCRILNGKAVVYIVNTNKHASLMSSLQNVSVYFNHIMETAKSEKEANELMDKETELHTQVRFLNYCLGTANLHCKYIKEKPKYAEGTQQYNEEMKAIVLLLYSASHSIKKFRLS